MALIDLHTEEGAYLATFDVDARVLYPLVISWRRRYFIHRDASRGAAEPTSYFMCQGCPVLALDQPVVVEAYDNGSH